MNWYRVGVFPGKISYVNGATPMSLAVEEALKLTGTQEFAHLPVEKLSGGQRQRCWIAMVLAQKTPYILLDEPHNLA